VFTQNVVGNLKMTSREFNRLLDDIVSAEYFKVSISDEVENYKRLMKKLGSSITLQLVENEKIVLNKTKFKRLLGMVNSGQLSNVHLAYICDCLSMANDLTADDITSDIIHELADPEINGGYADEETIMELMRRLS
jgi:uncharacterized membrane protein